MTMYGVAEETKTTIYTDVDGCLIFWPGPKKGSTRYSRRTGELPVPNNKIVSYLRQKYTEGFTIILWSMGGAEHCKWAAKLCGMEDIVSKYLVKPGTLVDDNHKWYFRNRIWIDENGCQIERKL